MWLDLVGCGCNSFTGSSTPFHRLSPSFPDGSAHVHVQCSFTFHRTSLHPLSSYLVLAALCIIRPGAASVISWQSNSALNHLEEMTGKKERGKSFLFLMTLILVLILCHPDLLPDVLIPRVILILIEGDDKEWVGCFALALASF